jgi:hypothetical protein
LNNQVQICECYKCKHTSESQSNTDLLVPRHDMLYLTDCAPLALSPTCYHYRTTGHRCFLNYRTNVALLKPRLIKTTHKRTRIVTNDFKSHLYVYMCANFIIRCRFDHVDAEHRKTLRQSWRAVRDRVAIVIAILTC